MSEHNSKRPYLLCIPLDAREKDEFQQVLEIQCAYPLGVLSHAQEMLDTLRLELEADNPLIDDFEGLVRVAKQAHLQADAFHRVVARGTFVLQPKGGAND
jgi:hypothetical protein